jgi:hypothetical protein
VQPNIIKKQAQCQAGIRLLGRKTGFSGVLRTFLRDIKDVLIGLFGQLFRFLAGKKEVFWQNGQGGLSVTTQR